MPALSPRRATVRGERTRRKGALFSRNAILLALAAITTSSTALAQDTAQLQTPDSAHEFLRVALMGASTSGVDFTIVKIESSGCLTVVYSETNPVGYSQRLRLDWPLIRSVIVSPDYPESLRLEGSMRPEYLENGKSSDIYEHSHGGISPLLAPSRGVITVGTEMAPRVMRAMEVIRKSCDRTKGLAF